MGNSKAPFSKPKLNPKNEGGKIPPGRGDGKYINAPFWKKGSRG
jgi:hypothetical protein